MKKAQQSSEESCPSSIEVTVDGKQLPLKIGDRIDIGDGVMRMVMKMQVNEDGKVMYGVQWIDEIDFKLDWLTWQELCFMKSLVKRKAQVGI